MKYNKAYLIAISRKISKEELNRAILRVKSLGLEVEYSDLILKSHLDFAGTPETRYEQLKQALKSDADIIMSVRGGWGVNNVLDFFDKDFLIKNYKPILGYSDITILLNYYYKLNKKIQFHGPNMLKQFPESDKSLEHLKKILSGQDFKLNIFKKDIIVPGTAKGKIVGGNIELILRGLGTKYQVNSRGKILFLEGINKRSYLLYDMLFQLRQAGVFRGCRGIVLGNFKYCKDHKKYLKAFFKDFEIPVIMNQPFGHDLPNYAIPIGGKCTMSTSKGIWKIKQ